MYLDFDRSCLWIFRICWIKQRSGSLASANFWGLCISDDKRNVFSIINKDCMLAKYSINRLNVGQSQNLKMLQNRITRRSFWKKNQRTKKTLTLNWICSVTKIVNLCNALYGNISNRNCNLQRKSIVGFLIHSTSTLQQKVNFLCNFYFLRITYTNAKG